MQARGAYRIVEAGNGFSVERRKDGPGGESWERRSLVPTQAEARDDVRFLYDHEREVAALDRRTPVGFRLANVKPQTPLGQATGRLTYGSGVNRFEAAGGASLHLTEKTNARVAHDLRSADGWYVDPVGMAAVVEAVPKVFTTWERHDAARTLQAARAWMAQEADEGPSPAPGM